MTIQGSGKSHPKGTKTTGGMERPRRAAEKRSAREVKPTATARSSKGSDVFEGNSGRPGAHRSAVTASGDASSPGLRAEELLASPGQVVQMTESILAHARRLTGEFEALRGEAQNLVSGLAQKGFSPEAVADTREEVQTLRRQMAHLRGKIAADGRRLKLLRTMTEKVGDLKTGEKLTAQLREIATMEKGWGRAFLALGIAGTLSAAADANRVAGRVAVGLSKDRFKLGGYLAEVAPESAAARLLLSLLQQGPQAPQGRLIAEAYAELHADVLVGKLGRGLQGLGLWRQAME